MRVLLAEQPERLHRKRWNSIAEKCHPVIYEAAALWKENILALKSLGENPPAELVEEIDLRFERELEKIRHRYSGNRAPAKDEFEATTTIFSDNALASDSESRGVTEWLHWEKHRTSLEKDIALKDHCDYGAAKRLLTTAGDVEQLRCTHARPLQPFKGNLEHSNIFEILWDVGLSELTPEELAHFFDEYCPCGLDHNPEQLKQQKLRFKRLLAAAKNRSED